MVNSEGAATICLKGDFVFQMHREFSAALGNALRPEVPEIVINLADVSYMDSAALGMLLVARSRALERGKRVAISGAVGHVLQVLHIANFEKLFEIR
ncbi:STAS domain-containing protein [Niveibacterium sp. COAC-50]|uniref:STAS domain-containing protein n=1 Tax=Niveibacterium sp. COAC-50 TaxID=2729384 RepID=UPI00155575D1|nr:STAS domain-containing protein [Niveibacterium sp. COAC-50]